LLAWALVSWLCVGAIVSLSLALRFGFDPYVLTSAVAACLAFVLFAFAVADLALVCTGRDPLNIDDPAPILRSRWTMPLTAAGAMVLAGLWWG
jgi:hypothetical protein